MAWALVTLVAALMPGAGLSARATAADGEPVADRPSPTWKPDFGPDWQLRFQLQFLLPSFK